MADQILVKYKTDISQTEKALADVQKELVLTEEIGEQAFDNIGKSAGGAANNVGKAAESAQRMAGATRNLQNSVNQLSRELPAFTMNLNTGFLAISNNLPYLFDGLKNIREQNKALAAEGKETTSVLKALGGAIFSWQTALSIGVTLLTVYGGKLVEYAFGVKESSKEVKEAAEQEKKYQDELKKSQKSLEDKTQALRNQLAAQKENKLVDEIDLRNKKAILEQMKQELSLMTLLTKNGAVQVQGNQQLTAQLYAEYEARLKRAEEIRKAIPSIQLEVDALEKQIPLLKEIAKEKELDLKSKQLEEEARKKAKEEKEKEEKWNKQYTERAFKAREEELKKQFELENNFRKLNVKSELELEIEAQKNQIKVDKEWVKYDKEIEKYEKDKAAKEIQLEQDTVNSLLSIQYSLMYLGATNQGAFAAFQKGVTFAQIAIDTAASISAIVRAATTTSLTPIQAAAQITAGVAGVLANIAKAKSLIEGTVIPPVPTLQMPQEQQTENKFKDGVIDLRGPGTETSDSIPAYLSKGESVIKAKSTRMFKDELYAINSNPLDYKNLIEQKYIIPAIEKERERQASFAENIARSIALHSNFNDDRIVKTLEKNKPATSKDIAVLAEAKPV